MSLQTFIAVDLGASSGRVCRVAWDGERFDLRVAHRFANTPVSVLGHSHWDVLALWREIKAGIAQIAEAAPISVGVDTWAVDYALLDSSGQLLGNPYIYRDRRTDGVLERVTARVPRERIFALTGIQFMPINTLYQLAAAAAQGDPQLEAARTLLTIPDLFHYWLSGATAAEYTNATTTQIYHAHERRWATELLRDLGIPHHFLPQVLQPGTQIGQLLPAVASEVGLPASVRVVLPASHDTASAVAAVPHLDASSAYISSGTWSLVGVETSTPRTDARALAANVTNEGGVGGTIRLLKNVMGLWLLQECQRVWGIGWDALLAEAAAAEPFAAIIDPDDPSLLAPNHMPRAIAALCQPAPTSRGAIARCALESLALKYRRTVELLEELTGQPIDTVRIVGGGSANAMLCQMTADACGRQVVAGPVEATALGNALVQAIAAGAVASLAEGRAAIARSVQTTAYTPRNAAAWDAIAAKAH